MSVTDQASLISRYSSVTEEKSVGATYTPKLLADFVARQIVQGAGKLTGNNTLRILDPALGHGELLVSLLEQLQPQRGLQLEVYGFETDPNALSIAAERLEQKFPFVSFHLESVSFLDFVLENFGLHDHGDLFGSSVPESYDLIIANPPYVRTQIMGAKQANILANQFGLSGRVDLYYAFILGMSRVLKPKGIAGIIVSNRFMTTKSGASIRQAIFERFNMRHAWDLGDTKLFGAAVLPAVLLVEGKNGHSQTAPAFSTIYETTNQANDEASDPIEALSKEGFVKINNGRCFHVQHGKLHTNDTPDGVWRIATEAVDVWLAKVSSHTWGTFRDIGKIRVGVKTCADKVFIRKDWEDMSPEDYPELLKPLDTHHIAHRFRPLVSDQKAQILYPHEVVHGRRRAVNLENYPRSQAYLEKNREALEGRRYVIEAGREWYEIWVPQDPDAWDQPKLVFRDISEEPTFWINLTGSVVNGDCYWLVCENTDQADLLWLACAVGNSTFIEEYYDLRFNNKLYAGRRRFITQYVEKFPLPDPYSYLGQKIISIAKQVYECSPSLKAEQLEKELNALVWNALTGDKED
ncbi:MAG: N-6 DNA methylase [Pseudohongiellaceae bacterium]